MVKRGQVKIDYATIYNTLCDDLDELQTQMAGVIRYF
jgi:hypothetical protein